MKENRMRGYKGGDGGGDDAVGGCDAGREVSQ